MDVEWYGLRLKPAQSEVDSGDKPAWRGPLLYSPWDAMFMILAVISVIGDVISDCYVAYVHAAHGMMLTMWLTIAFIVVPGWISTCASLLLIMQDRENRVKSQWSCKWLVVFHVLPLVLVPHYISSLQFALKSQQECRSRPERQMYYYQMLWEDYDASYLRLIEAFLEAAPQLLLQAVLVLIFYNEVKDEPSHYWPQLVIPMIFSLFSLSYAVVCYKRSLRIAQNAKRLSFAGTITLLCSQMSLVASRLIVLALFISVAPVEVTVVAILTRLLFNATWLSLFQFRHVASVAENVILRIILSVIYLFTYLDLCDGQTGRRQIVHHVAAVVDCGVLLALYGLYAIHLNVYCVVAAICLYPLGLMLLVSYYCKCHPTSMSDGVHFIEAPTVPHS
ncbi:XK-related protein 6-like [Varroa jacobsoni]|uniref:XK-related protein 6-like n=1 Tax=Varroa jacobsoni TaxID=62625 RepID=UPI000BF3BD73|nr:XK-related protein 6-like [Varroa jacobsoni]